MAKPNESGTNTQAPPEESTRLLALEAQPCILRRHCPSLGGGKKICCLTSHQRQLGGAPLWKATLPGPPPYPILFQARLSNQVLLRAPTRRPQVAGRGSPCLIPDARSGDEG